MSALNIQEVSGVSANYISNAILDLSKIGASPIVVTADPNPAVINSVYLVNTSGGPLNVTLPVSPAKGSLVTVVDQLGTAAASNITLVAGAGDTINGAAVVSVNFDSAKVVFNGRIWHRVV